jgi:hypothetical protein
MARAFSRERRTHDFDQFVKRGSAEQFLRYVPGAVTERRMADFNYLDRGRKVKAH